MATLATHEHRQDARGTPSIECVSMPLRHQFGIHQKPYFHLHKILCESGVVKVYCRHVRLLVGARRAAVWPVFH